MASVDAVWPDELFRNLDRTGPIPLYFQVSSRLEQAIQDGTIPPGARLANELEIADRLGVSRPTIRRAIQELVDRGLLVRRRGIGTQVVQGQVTRQVELTSLYEDLKRSKHAPKTVVLAHELVDATPHTAERLGVAPGDKVLFLRRLRSSDNTPIAMMENYLSPEFADISAEQLAESGLYEILRSRGVVFRIAKQVIGARECSAEEAKLLDLRPGGPVLTMDRVAYDQSGKAIEFGHHAYRPDRHKFETTLVAK